MVFGRRPQNPFMNPPSAEAFNPYMESQGEEEIPEVKTRDMDNDPCCEEARMKFRGIKETFWKVIMGGH